ncbi:MAG: hypothetical protein Ct9H300mP25_17760 [Acidobacteriota bacterium]|nr:MAG: hypothetical protein Ct9H300mP25_17760 [Acidobacteriota bacterium]
MARAERLGIWTETGIVQSFPLRLNPQMAATHPRGYAGPAGPTASVRADYLEDPEIARWTDGKNFGS